MDAILAGGLLSDAHPSCFLEFADFVSDILGRKDVSIADKSTLNRLVQ